MKRLKKKLYCISENQFNSDMLYIYEIEYIYEDIFIAKQYCNHKSVGSCVTTFHPQYLKRSTDMSFISEAKAIALLTLWQER